MAKDSRAPVDKVRLVSWNAGARRAVGRLYFGLT
jgi:hypothetical protein